MILTSIVIGRSNMIIIIIILFNTNNNNSTYTTNHGSTAAHSQWGVWCYRLANQLRCDMPRWGSKGRPKVLQDIVTLETGHACENIM